MSGYSNSKGYQFTLVNGAVTAVYEVKNGRVKREDLDSDEIWSINGSDVVKTEYEHGRSEITTYRDDDGDGIYSKISKSYSPNGNIYSNSQLTQSGFSPDYSTSVGERVVGNLSGYKFDVLDGNITQVYEVKHGSTFVEHLGSDEAWIIDGVNFVKTEYEHGLVEQSIYTDADGDGIFNQVSKSYISTSGVDLSVQLNNHEHGSDADDHWSGNESDDYYYGSLGNDFMDGGYGDDDLVGGDGDDSLNGNYGCDSLVSGDGNDVLYGGDGDDYLYAASGNDSVNGGAGNDIIIGGDGEGNDRYEGGLGFDTIKYTSAVSSITVDLIKSEAKSSFGNDLAHIGIDSIKGIENVVAGDFDDLIKGDSNLNILTGGLGVDSLYGGNDRVKDIFNFDSIFDSKLNLARDKIFNFVSKIDDIDLIDIDANSNIVGDQTFLFSNQTAKANSIWFKSVDVDGYKTTKDVVVYGDVNGDTVADFEIGLIGVSSLNAMDFIL
jgi:Ca2+-binding RTX toxin-like protein